MLTTRLLHPEIGVEIGGVDLSRPLDEATFDEILNLFYRHSVVVMRDQHLSAKAQADFLRRFGTPKISQRKEFHVPDVPEIGRVGNTRNADGSPSAFLDRFGNLWHNDTASDDHIDGLTMLSCVKTPKVGGDTLFASTAAAYATLDPAVKARIDGQKIVHNFNKHNDYLLARNPGSAKPLSAEDRAKWPDRIHDLVQDHPVTGDRLFFVVPTLTRQIGDLSETESETLAHHLIKHATRDGSVLRHRWQVGDLVFWDNRASLHSATPADYHGGERLLHRGYAYIDEKVAATAAVRAASTVGKASAPITAAIDKSFMQRAVVDGADLDTDRR